MAQIVTAILVTHNSERVLGKCLKELLAQSYPIAEIIIVDSGSTNTQYLEEFKDTAGISIICTENIGYAKANNYGFMKCAFASHFILFLNPDTFLTRGFVEKALQKMKKNPHVGALSGKLLGFDLNTEKTTGKIDSTGVFRKFYGKWYDRGQNMLDRGSFSKEELVPALCGALLFCRMEALKCFEDRIFDPDFFLYKEDIEFSLRLRKHGWRLLYSPELEAFHCRGWKKRTDIPYHLKKSASQSEILLYKKHPSPYIFWALLKYWLVILFRM